MKLPGLQTDPSDSAELESGIDAETLRRRRRRRIASAWAGVFGWALLIWHLGGDEFSATHTNSILAEWFRTLFYEVDAATRHRMLIALRKSAHLVEYAILALLTFRAALLSAGRNQLATAGCIALFLVATLASADEFRQSFSRVRTGSPYDVVLDLAGGSIAIIGLLAIYRRMRHENASAEAAKTT